MELIIIVCLGCVLVVAGILWLKEKSRVKQLDAELRETLGENDRLASHNSELARFQQCLDAEKKAAQILGDAKRTAESTVTAAEQKSSALVSSTDLKCLKMIETAKSESVSLTRDARALMNKAQTELASAQTESKLILREAKNKAAALTTEAEGKANSIQMSATTRYSEIIAAAEQEAKRIAGDAYEVAANANYYRKLATTMKNIIEGYGNRYLRPTESVLDSLAEEFGFTEAGQELARARKLRTLMSENLTAATSDYVETSRHDTAVRFIIDAFNGKVDSILSTVKVGNIGTLEQKIRDAYTVVNSLGRAFRSTKITPQYLNECLDELKWAVAVVALKEQAKEEQRAIKEKLREEARARREYERAIKDAEKQESAIRKAIEKATAQLEQANQEQRQKFEEQLAQLQTQLSEAEARNQRALSMAQQTRSGHVYVISNIGSFGENVYKIGMTRRLEPTDRVRELGDASVPFPFDIHAMIYSEDAPALETELHKLFSKSQVNKTNPRKEFFRLPISVIREYVDSKGMNVKWTMEAEAAQYRETLAMEQAFSHDSDLEKEWESRQLKELESVDFETEEDDA